MFVVSKAIWWIPSPFFSMNLAMGEFSLVAARSSIFTSPNKKNEVITPSDVTSSLLYGSQPSS